MSYQRMGYQNIYLSRPIKRLDGLVQNYPVRMRVNVIDRCVCGHWEYIATAANVVFKRPRIGHDFIQETAMWQCCPELCVHNRGVGSLECFGQIVILLAEKENECLLC